MKQNKRIIVEIDVTIKDRSAWHRALVIDLKRVFGNNLMYVAVEDVVELDVIAGYRDRARDPRNRN